MIILGMCFKRAVILGNKHEEILTLFSGWHESWRKTNKPSPRLFEFTSTRDHKDAFCLVKKKRVLSVVYKRGIHRKLNIYFPPSMWTLSKFLFLDAFSILPSFLVPPAFTKPQVRTVFSAAERLCKHLEVTKEFSGTKLNVPEISGLLQSPRMKTVFRPQC